MAVLRQARGVALAATVFAAACAPASPTVPSRATLAADCDDMCEAFKRLGCVAAEPSPVLGVSCVERCRTQVATDVVAPPIACIVRARDVSELEDLCGERCR